MSDEIQVSVSTQEGAERLREDFEEVLARVNGDMMGRFFRAEDPSSMEREILQAEQLIDYHLRAFEENAPLQSLAGQIKALYAENLRQQALQTGTPERPTAE